jgi:hypothetical protein
MKKIIGLATNDFSLYYDIVKALKLRGATFESLASTKHIPQYIGVIITTRQEAKNIKFSNIIQIENFLSIDEVVESAIKALTDKESEEILVGIDPGDRTGIAVFSSGILIKKTALRLTEDSVAELKKIVESYGAKKILVRIGNGAKHQRNFIVKRIRGMPWEIELVEEKNTSLQTAIPKKKDMDAAALIALKPGKKLDENIQTNVTRGEIQFIQERSNQKTGGLLTISQDLARRVILGDISIDEAIKIQIKAHK